MTIINNVMLENAEAFIIKWKGTTSERGEAQSFTNDFFKIFGLDRKNLAQFEKPIQKKMSQVLVSLTFFGLGN